MPRPRPPITAAPTLLRLMQLASPALPVGGFSYSEGLESAVDAGLVGNEAQAGDWLLDQLALVQARSEFAVAARAYVAWRRHLRVGGRLFAIVGEPPVMQAQLITCTAPGATRSVTLFETCVAPLVNAPQSAAFVF